MALRTAEAHASRVDVVATVSNLGIAVVAEANARLAERRQWALNDKGIVDRAGLSEAHDVLASAGSSLAELTTAVSSTAGILGVT
jgi:hypothetical protein